MVEPTVSELTESVIETGREMNVQLAGGEGGLVLVASRDMVFDPPVPFAITADALREYFRSIAADVSEADAWGEWRMLMSTHLSESLYELSRIDCEAVIVIDSTGFRAMPATDPRATAGR